MRGEQYALFAFDEEATETYIRTGHCQTISLHEPILKWELKK